MEGVALVDEGLGGGEVLADACKEMLLGRCSAKGGDDGRLNFQWGRTMRRVHVV